MKNSWNQYGDLIAFVGGRLIDGRGGPPLEKGAIVIRGKNIEAVGPSEAIQIPDQARLFDVSGMTIMPGMTDMHVHLYWNGEPNLALHSYKESTAFRAVKAVAYIQRSLESGFTTLRSGGKWGSWM